MIFYLFASIIGFGLKYIVSEGVLNYFSEHTFIHLFYKYVKEKNEQLSEMAISEIEKKNLALTCFVSILFLSLLSFVPYIGIPLMVVYGVFLYLHLNNKLIDIKQHYQQLIDQTNRMIEGEFKEITEDLGSFNDLRDSLNKVKDGFEKAVDKEVSASKMKTELISNVSHDLKTPLTCIKNYVVLLQNTKDEQEREAYLKELNHYTNRMTQLIEDLFDVARVNSGEMNIKKTELDIVSLLNQALIESDEILSSKKLQIIKNSNVDKQMVMLDGEKTYRVFENLINNIGKYALDNTRVYIDLNVDEDITISFKNISKAEMNFTSEEIVERFKRGDKSRHQSGSGLGLAIAKSFTEVQEGKFDLTIDGDMFKVVLHFKK
jgi:signal transduction histidine kinase